jgi:hypothetical protein
VALATIAALLISYATVSRRLQRLTVFGAMFFTTAGLLVGPMLGLADLQVHDEQVKRLAEITLTLVLFGQLPDSGRHVEPWVRPRVAVSSQSHVLAC